MYTPWQVIVQELVAGGSSRTADLVRFAYADNASEGVRLQSLAQVFMIIEPEQGVLSYGYALAWYLKEREWTAVIACGQDVLEIATLRLTAVRALFEAAVHLGSLPLLQKYAELVCSYQARGVISQSQLVGLFFEAIVPYYHKKERAEEIMALRQVLQAYSPSSNRLLYTHLQANLYAYTTDIAQELIGQPDVFPGK